MPVPPVRTRARDVSPLSTEDSGQPSESPFRRLSRHADTFWTGEDSRGMPSDRLLLSSPMSIRDLVRWGDARLLAENEEVLSPDGDLAGLVADLVETCHAAPGVGLAAPQIGVNRRVAVIDLSVGEDVSAVIVLVNPVILSTSGDQKEEEGCLSVPDVSENVVRPARVVVRAADEHLQVREIEGSGLLARALCHEIDHLNGVLFVDRMRGLKRELTWRKIERRHARGVW
jgi:peptide deformylase